MPSTILYIEDDPASRSLVERTLRYGGYRVLIADCALDGLDVARRELPDLILTDINLPDMSGREITTMLRRDPRFKKTPIVALTAMTMGEQRELALAAGLTGCWSASSSICKAKRIRSTRRRFRTRRRAIRRNWSGGWKSASANWRQSTARSSTSTR